MYRKPVDLFKMIVIGKDSIMQLREFQLLWPRTECKHGCAKLNLGSVTMTNNRCISGNYKNKFASHIQGESDAF